MSAVLIIVLLKKKLSDESTKRQELQKRTQKLQNDLIKVLAFFLRKHSCCRTIKYPFCWISSSQGNVFSPKQLNYTGTVHTFNQINICFSYFQKNEKEKDLVKLQAAHESQQALLQKIQVTTYTGYKKALINKQCFFPLSHRNRSYRAFGIEMLC